MGFLLGFASEEFFNATHPTINFSLDHTMVTASSSPHIKQPTSFH